MTPQKFEVDYAFGQQHSNQDVYESITMPLIKLALKGGKSRHWSSQHRPLHQALFLFFSGISTLLAYGQTGSGKTHTITGILERIGRDLFEVSHHGHRDENGASYLRLHLTSFELLGEAVDLLKVKAKGEEGIVILEDAFGGINFKNATEVALKGPDDLDKAVKSALKARTTKATFKNDTSSRSHAVFCIRVENTFLK